jgi:hypothetical protein
MATSFSRAPSPIWYFPDLEGLPLNDEYFIFFLTNVFPYVPQAIFQDPAGTIPWNNPLEFFPNGTLPDNLYFNDSEVYRLEIRHGNTQADPLIYEINDFVPGGGSVTPGTGVSAGFGENQVTMSTFSEVSFSSPLTITTAGTYHVAPGWDLIVTGVGTGTITQNIGLGNQNFVNDPNFALGISLFGFSTARLVQRFDKNGAIWMSTSSQDGYVSMSITAQAQTSVYGPITFFYTPSTGTPIQIGSTPGTINTGSYQVYDATQLMPKALTNTDPSNVAFVDMVINLLGTGHILITNIQVVGQEVPTGTTPAPLSPPYQQQTNERQIDHLFHYYRNSIILQAKDTILTGWNFPLNPYQFNPTAITTITNQTQYIADQTIIHQEAASKVATGNAGFADNFGLEVQAVAASGTRFALIQYPDSSTTLPYWSYNLSALVKLRFSSINNTTVGFKMLLMYRTIGAPPTLSASEPIVGWSGNDLSVAAGWTVVKPTNDPVYTVGTTLSGADQSFAFNGFKLPTAISGTQYLAAVFYTVSDMSNAGTPDFFVIDSISLVENDFAIDTQPQTFDDVLRQCQFYYEKSYDNATLPGASTVVGVIDKYQTALFSNVTDAGSCYAAPWEFQFNTVKRAIPVTTIISTVGTVNNVSVQTFRDGVASALTDKIIASFWVAGGLSTKSVEYLSTVPTPGTLTTAVPASNLNCVIRFHYSAVAFLGA